MNFRHFRHFRVDYADYVDYARQCKKQKLTLSHYSVKAFGLLFVHFHGLSTFSTFSTFSECIFPTSDIYSLKIRPLAFMDFRHFKHYRTIRVHICQILTTNNYSLTTTRILRILSRALFYLLSSILQSSIFHLANSPYICYNYPELKRRLMKYEFYRHL